MLKCLLAAVLMAVLLDLAIDHGEQTKRAVSGMHQLAISISHMGDNSIFTA